MKTCNFIYTNKGKIPNKDIHCSNVWQFTNGNFYSYGSHYPLLFKIGKYWFVNNTGYSATTRRHISWARRDADFSVQLEGEPIVENIHMGLKKEKQNLEIMIDKGWGKANLIRKSRRDEIEETLNVLDIRKMVYDEIKQ